MAEKRITPSSMMEPPIEDLLGKVDSKFTLVTLAARRGRQINAYFNQLGEGLGAIVPPQVVSESRKPLTIALEEIAAGKIVTTEKKEKPVLDNDAGLGSELAAAESAAMAAAKADMEAVFGTSVRDDAADSATDAVDATGTDAGEGVEQADSDPQASAARTLE